jgi:hypothetical protein
MFRLLYGVDSVDVLYFQHHGTEAHTLALFLWCSGLRLKLRT